jgi:hypothetical protein
MAAWGEFLRWAVVWEPSVEEHNTCFLRFIRSLCCCCCLCRTPCALVASLWAACVPALSEPVVRCRASWHAVIKPPDSCRCMAQACAAAMWCRRGMASAPVMQPCGGNGHAARPTAAGC